MHNSPASNELRTFSESSCNTIDARESEFTVDPKPLVAHPEAETAGFDEEEYEEQSNSEEEGQDIQAVILVPGEFMGLDPQNTASSRGLIGLSWKILDSLMALSLYL
ncbi:hypothetical protein F7725_013123 [Dissostichus mawsoni]|uniref:Uncharacterized protein n=1 Tax=Dissostichus mawsoni TaxID=36200 RepID=A0A7J5YR07_DISMA|nr:hypothetical protein F7725_013123 [Dissostichus mawsoni]